MDDNKSLSIVANISSPSGVANISSPSDDASISPGNEDLYFCDDKKSPAVEVGKIAR